MKHAYKILKRIPEKHIEDLSIDGMIISNCILNKEDMKMWNGFIWHRIKWSIGSLL
jgi:hypothetical protein